MRGFHSYAEASLAERNASSVVFVSRLSDLPSSGAKRFKSGPARHVLFLDDSVVESVAGLTRLGILTPNRLHVSSRRELDRVEGLVYRLLSGMTSEGGPPPIVDAWVEDGRIVLLSATFERLAVPVAKLTKLLGANEDEIREFEIDEDGSFLHWPHADSHLGWDQFRQLIDPAAELVSGRRSSEFNKRYGASIRMLREETGLKQSEVEGITDRHLRRVEQGEVAATRSTLQALADAHSLPLEDYLSELASRLTD